MSIIESLSQLSIDKLSEIVGGRYRLTKLVSLRLKEINQGAPFLVERRENESPLATICREIEEGKIHLQLPEEEVQIEEMEFDLLGLGEDIDL